MIKSGFNKCTTGLSQVGRAPNSNPMVRGFMWERQTFSMMIDTITIAKSGSFILHN